MRKPDGFDNVEAIGNSEYKRLPAGGYVARITKVTDTPDRDNVADLLVSYHLQNYVLPLLEEEEVKFDPLDETQVDLSGIVNAPTKSEADDSDD